MEFVTVHNFSIETDAYILDGIVCKDTQLQMTRQQIQCVRATGPHSSEVFEITYNEWLDRVVIMHDMDEDSTDQDFTIFKDPNISLRKVLESIGVGIPNVGILSIYDETYEMPDSHMDEFIERPVKTMPCCQIVVSDLWNARHRF